MPRPSYQTAQSQKRTGIHPVWRGIGCILIMIIPLVAFSISYLLVDAQIPQTYFPIPLELAQRYNVPGFGRIPLLYILVITLVVMLLLGAVLSVLYSVVYRIAGPPTYGPLDAPPIKRKTKKSR